MLQNAKQKLRKNWVIALVALLFTALRLLMARGLMIRFESGSIYDDLLQADKVLSLLGGDWLGPYGSMTLVKGVGYPLLTAFFSRLGLPYILAYHMLYVAACAVFIAATRRIWKKVWVAFLAYAFLLFNPIAFSDYITRLYRDIGYYSLSFLVVGLALGFLLRCDQKRGGLGYGLACGFFLALAANFREDSQWLFVYVAACLLVYLFLRLKQNKRQFLKSLLVPAAIALGFALFVAPVSLKNHAVYGTYALDEYNSGAFARAYGALSRVNNEAEDPHYAICYAEREQLYALSPAFAELEYWLDGEDSPFRAWLDAHGDYRTGYFSFVLREAAAQQGYYSSSAAANEYFNRLADEVNALCDSGAIDAGPCRNTIAARLYPRMIPAIAADSFKGMWYTLRCTGVYPIAPPANEDNAYLAKYENAVYGTIMADRYMEDTGKIEPNYPLTGFSAAMQWLARGSVALYRLALPVLFLAALAGFISSPFIAKKRKRRDTEFWLAWVAALSLLCAFALRSFMIGFVNATSFTAITTPPYQAACYPLALAFVTLSAAMLASLFTKNKFATESQPPKLNQ